MTKVKSKYARVFDSSCTNWEKDKNFNLLYLKAQERHFNDILRFRGYVFLKRIKSKETSIFDERLCHA